jgi:hypothetical protein
MGFLKRLQRAARKAGEIGDRLPTGAEMVYGKKPKTRKAAKRRR